MNLSRFGGLTVRPWATSFFSILLGFGGDDFYCSLRSIDRRQVDGGSAISPHTPNVCVNAYGNPRLIWR
jgi:hypothetical protein